MADAELIRHQQIWKSFTTFVKLGTGGVLLLLVILWATLIL
ncbi:MAG TPA: hypothetical protein VM689_25170 [Aliidongia sp.]|nr:hypothetical protein [Aliidongia sp.]